MVLNLTQHEATPDQIEAGVVEPSEADKALIRSLLTFQSPPCREAMRGKAEKLARLARRYSRRKGGPQRAMVGGAPFFMSHLEQALRDYGVSPVYAFSVREVEEQQHPDGSVRKVAVFRHTGWVEA